MDNASFPVELGLIKKVPWGFPSNICSAMARVQFSTRHVLISLWAAKSSRLFEWSSSPTKAFKC